MLSALAGIGVSFHKVHTRGFIRTHQCLTICAQIATDIRLLASRKEIEEPFDKDQIGSRHGIVISVNICSRPFQRYGIQAQSDAFRALLLAVTPPHEPRG